MNARIITSGFIVVICASAIARALCQQPEYAKHAPGILLPVVGIAWLIGIAAARVRN